jgi:phosphate transport system substrate-binding protein
MCIYTTTATYPLVVDLTTAYNESHPLQGFVIRYANYGTMLESLNNGDIFYFITSHLPVNSLLWAAPIGQDAIAIIVNADVDLRELTTGQLRAIYQGHITRWSELGGAQQAIIVFSREDGSGTRAEFERMVMGYRRTTANAFVVSSNALMAERVARQSGSIGYLSMGYLEDSVVTLALDGVLPTQNNVLNNLYPLRSMVFVVGLDEPEGRFRTLVGWMQSPEGQAVVAQRYAPLIPAVPGTE